MYIFDIFVLNAHTRSGIPGICCTVQVRLFENNIFGFMFYVLYVCSCTCIHYVILERAVYNISPDPSRWTTVRRSDRSPQLQLDAKSHLNLR